MSLLKSIKNKLSFDSNSFEMVVSLSCMVAAGVFAFFNRPTSIPLSPMTVVMVGTMMGFVVGFFTSAMVVAVYKAVTRKRVVKKVI